jgi:hypothetical protein
MKSGIWGPNANYAGDLGLFVFVLHVIFVLSPN